jgi:6-phosphogluconolactonase/glucosamine-6-phosphate isomerase/deaminase
MVLSIGSGPETHTAFISPNVTFESAESSTMEEQTSTIPGCGQLCYITVGYSSPSIISNIENAQYCTSM